MKIKPASAVMGLICCCGVPFMVIVNAIMVAKSQHTRPYNQWEAFFDISPNGKEMVISTPHDSMDIYLFNLDTKVLSPLVSTGYYEWAPRFSSDGTKVTFSGGIPGDRADHVFIFDRKTKTTTQITSGDFNDTSPMFYDQDRKILFEREDQYRWGGLMSSWDEQGPLQSLDLSSKNITVIDKQVLDSHPVSPSGHLIQIGNNFARVGPKLCEPSGKEPVDLQLTEDGNIVLKKDGASGDLLEVDLTTGKHKTLNTTDDGRSRSNPRYSPDRKSIYFVSHDMNSFAICKMDRKSGKVEEIVDSGKLFSAQSHPK